MRYNELSKTFNNERDAFEYRDEIWFEYGVMGTVYSTGTGNTQTVVFEEEDE